MYVLQSASTRLFLWELGEKASQHSVRSYQALLSGRTGRAFLVEGIAARKRFCNELFVTRLLLGRKG